MTPKLTRMFALFRPCSKTDARCQLQLHLSKPLSELVRLKVDVIVALYVPSALAAKQATREIPIVIIAAEPIETGIVASWARPGGNITGVVLMSAALVGKCVELFRDMISATRRIAVLTNAADPLFANLVVNQVELAGRITGIEIQPIMVRGPDRVSQTFLRTLFGTRQYHPF